MPKLRALPGKQGEKEEQKEEKEGTVQTGLCTTWRPQWLCARVRRQDAHPVLRSQPGSLAGEWARKHPSELVAGAWAVVLAEAASGADRVPQQKARS